MNYLFKRLGIKIKTVTPYNHQSLQTEHGIKSLSNILTKHLTSKHLKFLLHEKYTYILFLVLSDKILMDTYIKPFHDLLVFK